MLKTALKVSAFSVALLSASLSYAGDAAQQLSERLSGYNILKAQFVQYTLSESGGREQKTEGEFTLKKPNLFRWHTQPPLEQTIVGDGAHIWVYDPDLLQVTKKPDSVSQGNSAPALILNGQVDKLKQRFTITTETLANEQNLFVLTPKSSDSNFSRIRLLFNDDYIGELLLEDNLGQRTLMQFSNVEINPSVEADLFKFTVPQGADVIEDNGA